MKMGAIYARYSSDKQNQETITTQVEKCRDFCDRNDILVCETFVDEGKTGTTEGGAGGICPDAGHGGEGVLQRDRRLYV
jgi:hypothetical protein